MQLESEVCDELKHGIAGRLECVSSGLDLEEEWLRGALTQHQIRTTKLFSKLELKHTNWQIAMDRSGQNMRINTIGGLFKVNHLQMGLKNSSVIFQHCLETALAGIFGLSAKMTF